MEKIFKKPLVQLELKNVRCYCCIFKDKKVTYYVRKKSTSSHDSGYDSTSDDVLEQSDKKQVSTDHEDKTEDLQIYCCCYHLLKSFLS